MGLARGRRPSRSALTGLVYPEQRDPALPGAPRCAKGPGGPGGAELQAGISPSHRPQGLCDGDNFLVHSKGSYNCFLEPGWPPLPRPNFSTLVAMHRMTSEMELSTGF